MNTREVVEELLGRMAHGEAEAIADLFASDVDFSRAGNAPWIKPRRSREDMADFFAEMDASFVPEERSASVSTVLV
ncbi:MAG: nuclear transport factor 2 family protein [Rubrobacteraceae bacterium]